MSVVIRHDGPRLLSISAQQERRTTTQQITDLTREEVRSVAEELKGVLERLGLGDLTGSLTVRTNRGGICEINFSVKA